MPFSPKVDEVLRIDGEIFRFAAQPGVPDQVVARPGLHSTVYQLIVEPGRQFAALKVFAPQFRVPRTAYTVGWLYPYSRLPGLQACARTVLTPEDNPDLLAQYPDLAYAVLMPWIEGPTWQEVVASRRSLDPETCAWLARSLVQTLRVLEQNRAAHGNISGADLLLPGLAALDSGKQPVEGRVISLVGLENLYGPGLIPPENPPTGLPGYAHRNSRVGVWAAEADRFAGAVLVAEMLGWCDESVRTAAAREHYFDPAEIHTDSPRYQLLRGTLRRRWGAPVAAAFSTAWHSSRFGECPSLDDWSRLLGMSFATQPAAARPPAGSATATERAPLGAALADAVPETAALADASSPEAPAAWWRSPLAIAAVVVLLGAVLLCGTPWLVQQVQYSSTQQAERTAEAFVRRATATEYARQLEATLDSRRLQETLQAQPTAPPAASATPTQPSPSATVTRLAATATQAEVTRTFPAQSGSLTGGLSYPGGAIPVMRVVAYSAKNADDCYWLDTPAYASGASASYLINGIPPGDYYVVAFPINQSAGFAMGFTLNNELYPIAIEVNRITSNINLGAQVDLAKVKMTKCRP